MSAAELPVRRLNIDLATPIPRHWNGGDAVRTAFFDALSMSFPLGEQFFIDAVRVGLSLLPAGHAMHAQVQGFIGQEATHRRIHTLYNAQLAAQGHVNRWEPRIAARQRELQAQTSDARHALAVTAANEHFTAILAAWLLQHADVALAGAEPRLATLWQWHAAEELEHRSVAFDLYAAVGGSLSWRRRWFFWATLFFIGDVLRQTVSQLRHDGALWRWRTAVQAARFLFGRPGLVTGTARAWAAYWRAGFQPSQHDDGARATAWLRAHADDYAVVSGGSASAS